MYIFKQMLNKNYIQNITTLFVLKKIKYCCNYISGYFDKWWEHGDFVTHKIFQI